MTLLQVAPGVATSHTRRPDPYNWFYIKFSSSMSSYSPSFFEVCYDPLHLTTKCPLLSLDSFLQRAITRLKNMHKLTGERTLGNIQRSRCNCLDCFRGGGRRTSFSSDTSTKVSQIQKQPAPKQKNYSEVTDRQVS